MVKLPAELQQIRDAEAERPNRIWPFVRHQIQYVYGESETLLADFLAQGPLHIPVEGQVVSVHGVDVKCLSVDISYEATEEGAPAVFATIVVDAAGLFAHDPSAPEEG